MTHNIVQHAPLHEYHHYWHTIGYPFTVSLTARVPRLIVIVSVCAWCEPIILNYYLPRILTLEYDTCRSAHINCVLPNYCMVCIELLKHNLHDCIILLLYNLDSDIWLIIMIILLIICLAAHAQARYTVVCLCVCVCLDYFSCSRINEVQVRLSIGF